MAVDPPLEPTVRAVQALSPQGQEMAVTVVRQLEQKVAINVPLGPGQRFEAPLFFPNEHYASWGF